MSSISVVIPAYNEGKRILNVLSVLTQVAGIESIIVVDDGSKDNTAEVVRSYLHNDPRINLIQHPINLGKGQSIFSAWISVHTEFVLMLDADLMGLTPDHIAKLTGPVLSGEAAMTLGVFKGGNWKTDFSHWITPWLTGQRCMRRDMLQCVDHEAASGYGLETALTISAHQQKWKVKEVPLLGMSHPISEVHRGGLGGLLNRLKMYRQIIRAWYCATAKPRVEPAIKVRD